MNVCHHCKVLKFFAPYLSVKYSRGTSCNWFMLFRMEITKNFAIDTSLKVNSITVLELLTSNMLDVLVWMHSEGSKALLAITYSTIMKFRDILTFKCR